MSGTPPTPGCGGVVVGSGSGSNMAAAGGAGGGGIGGSGPLGAPMSAMPLGVPPQGGGGAATPSAVPSSEHFCLRWNNYQTNMTTVFDQLLQEEVFVDVTLSCEGGTQLRAHKVVLAACSPYFQAVLQHNPCKHPIIIMPREVVFTDLRAIIEFVYRGEIDVAQEQIHSLLQAAETLKIKGLCEVSDDPSNMPPGFTATPTSKAMQVNGQSNFPVTNNVSPAHQSRGRPPLNRGRYSYRPRGRPPLYGRQRYDRPHLPSRTPSTRDQTSKRIKTELSEDEHSNGSNSFSISGGLVSSSAGVTSNVCPGMSSVVSTTPSLPSVNDMQRSHSAHYLQDPTQQLQQQQQSQHNDDNPSGVNQGSSAPDYDAYYVKTEDQQHHQHQQQQQQQQQQQGQGHQQSGHMSVGQHLQPDPNDPSGQRMTVTPELLGLMPSANPQYASDSDSLSGTPAGRKLWTDEDMDKALDALRNSQMSLSRAAQVFGIPATTLWQRAHRMGIETPKKEGANKTWSEHDLAGALEELRSGRLSANRASKEFGIPNSTLYKIARKEGIKLSSPFSAIQPSWNPEDLNKALDAIRGGMSVQKSAQEFGIPTGTLYGRCRREGIELSKYQGVPWSEEDMKDALEVVRVGEMSINQAAIHYNLPYSSLYGRFKRGKYEDGLSHQDFLHQEMTIEQFSNDHMAVQSGNLQGMQSQPTSLSQQTTPPHQNSSQALPTSAPPEQY
ncbi:protein bric-a-brac 2 isoform X3 [Hyalella azteca]|uniref:Protein bric-a-brac 2 isoform X3 n=1 Tax=Hyalella azteca TaxID=294128 RepID=A0A8B7NQW3_HYAAZ|nr:protein bric-a-brac 2 isoform X3 [Hyalella azteca]